MKKFLSLVLALVMAMSLVTISAGAKDFTDSADVKYDAAVEVMSELKVIDGYTDGSFRPSTQLNRGAAAKIICNMILGPTTASALSASSAPFSDVPADSVFAGYITYCSKEGIIDGYADGTFRPTAPLTGYAFAKMLLGALGYDPALEGYVGANWSINVAKQALGIGLDDGIDGFVGTQYVNRETACQMALNALQADMVEYDSKTTVTVNGAEVVVGGSEAKKISVDKDVKETFDDDQVLQFAEEYFSNLKVAPQPDDFGRPGKEWKIGKKSVGVFADKADASYTVAVKGKEIYADLGGDADEAKIVAFMDGEGYTPDAAFAIAKKDYTTEDGDKMDVDKKVGATGTLTEVFFDEENEKITIVIVNTYFMQVSGDYDEDEEVVTLTEVADTEDYTGKETVELELSVDTFPMIADLKDEDYVLVTIAAGEIKSIELAEPTTAVVDEHVIDETLTADGSEYKFSWAWVDTAANTDADAETNYQVDEAYELYFDFYGNIIYSEKVEAEDIYLFGYEYAKNNHMNKKAKVEAYAYFIDGSEETIGVKKFDTKKVDGSDEDQKKLDGYEKEWVKYAENSDGTYDLESVDNVTGKLTKGTLITNEDNVMINVGAKEMIRGTKATVFVVVDDEGDVEVYTGIKNVPELKAGENSFAVALCDGKYAEYVFVELADGESDGTDDSADVIFFLDNEKQGTDAADNDYYRYKAIVNGEVEKIRTLQTAAMEKLDGVMAVEVKYDAETGYIKAVGSIAENSKKDEKWDEDYDHLVANGTVTQNNGVITIVETGEKEDVRWKYYMADDATIFVIDDDMEVETITAKKLAKEYKETALVADVYGVMADGEYTYLYIVL